MRTQRDYNENECRLKRNRLQNKAFQRQQSVKAL